MQTNHTTKIRPLQINDRVEVFYDPITRQEREGIAHINRILIAKEGTEDSSYCIVSFEGDEDYQFHRWVSPHSVLGFPVA